jgi:hypothetical protein
MWGLAIPGLIVLGILLLITAYKQWRNEDDPDGPPPKWLVMLDTLTPLKAFGIGVGLVLISGKFWVFTLSAIGVIEEAQLKPSTAAFLFFYSWLSLCLAIIVRVIIPEQSKAIMESISLADRYNHPVCWPSLVWIVVLVQVQADLCSK